MNGNSQLTWTQHPLNHAPTNIILSNLTVTENQPAAGMMLSGNRLSKQIDTLILPYRESFAAVFFVTLGTLLHPLAFFEEPLLLAAGLVGVLILKSLAAAVALKLIGLSWKAAAGMGIGLAQLGEFSFLVIAEGVGQGIISRADYNRMLFIALGTLILTPQLIKLRSS